MTQAFEALRSRDAQAYSDAVAAATVRAVAAATRAPSRTPPAPVAAGADVRRHADRADAR